MGSDSVVGDGDDAGATTHAVLMRRTHSMLTTLQTFGYYDEYQDDSIYTKAVVAIVW